MGLSWTISELSEALGVDLQPALQLAPEDRPLPWHTRLIVGGAGWIASLLFLSFFGLLGIFSLSQYVLLAPLLVAVALPLRRLALPAIRDFKDQIALVLALTARALMAAGLMALTETVWITALGMIAFELVLGLGFPDPLQRFLSTLGIGSWVVALGDIGDAWWDTAWMDAVAIGATATALGLWALRGPLERGCIRLDEALGWRPDRWFDTKLLGDLVLPVAYGATTFSLALQLRFFVGRSYGVTLLTGTGTAALALALVAWLLWTHRVRPTLSAGALLVTAALGLAGHTVPGLALALSFVLVGIRAREVRLVGLASTFLVIYAVYFYYRLDVTLAAKGAALIGSGVVLLLARLAVGIAREHEGSPARSPAGARVLALVGLLSTLTLVATQVTAAEHHLSTGQTVYLELAPRDPRSLFQGDFMRLEYQVARDIQRRRSTRGPRASLPDTGHAVLRIDGDQIGTFVRLHDGTPLQDDERLLRFVTHGGRVQVASRAFLFEEGHARAYEPARYGALVLDAQGQGVLTALADSGLQHLGTDRRRW